MIGVGTPAGGFHSSRCRCPIRGTPRARGGLALLPQLLALGLTLALLFNCDSGCEVCPTPDMATPAMETPGPLSPTEYAYSQQIHDYYRQLLSLDQTLVTERSQRDASGRWPPATSNTLAQVHATLAIASAVQPPPRLRAIHEHWRTALPYYQQAFGFYDQAFGNPGTELNPATYTATEAARDEMNVTIILLEGFQV